MHLDMCVCVCVSVDLCLCVFISVWEVFNVLMASFHSGHLVSSGNVTAASCCFPAPPADTCVTDKNTCRWRHQGREGFTDLDEMVIFSSVHFVLCVHREHFCGEGFSIRKGLQL